ncbi:YolD-like family protein [Sporosarcina sp. SAFN-015]|uniref:YolD-like family protein n=1 Tax=Sporosarcina sp. SAFN-015 TaxID=3387274 RepID=UPI003F80680E
MIRDRGRIKWTAMMLPEHVAELRKWTDLDNYIARPELNEWDLQLVQEELELVCKMKCETLIKVWNNGRIIYYQGVVEDIDYPGMCIVLEGSFNLQRVPVADILNLQCMG